MRNKWFTHLKPAGDAGSGGATGGSGSPDSNANNAGGTTTPPAGSGTPGAGNDSSGTAKPDPSLPAWVSDPANKVSDKGRGLVALKKYQTPGDALDALDHAQQFIGAPADEMFRFPKTGLSAEDRRKLADKMGVPKDADGYVKILPATEQDKEQTAWFKQTAAKLLLTPEQAEGLAKEHLDRMSAQEANAVAENEAGKAAAKAALSKDWGADMQRRIEVCETAVATLGITKEELGQLKEVMGHERLVRMVWDKIVSKMGEAQFRTQTQSPGGFTADSARARKAELLNDDDFRKRHAEGNLKPAEQKEWTDVHRAIAREKEGSVE